MTTITATTRIRIALDAAEDLSAAGWPREEADDLGAAWRGALAHVAERLGLEDVESVSSLSDATRHDMDDDWAERVLWQAAHDLTTRSGDEPGDLWQWRAASERQIAGLRRALGLPGAAEAA